MRQQLPQQSERLKHILETGLQVSAHGTALFQTIWMNHAVEYYQRLAQQGRLVRLLDQKDGLRFGLPPNELAFERLEQTLNHL